MAGEILPGSPGQRPSSWAFSICCSSSAGWSLGRTRRKLTGDPEALVLHCRGKSRERAVPSLKHHRFPARLLVVSAVLLPTVLCAAAAWLDYRITLARAEEYVATTANALAHQAGATLQTANLVLLRAL